MPDLIRHPEPIESTGFRVKPGMTRKAFSIFYESIFFDKIYFFARSALLSGSSPSASNGIWLTISGNPEIESPIF
jgi:hypothetical protein